MARNGSGVFSRLYNWVNDRDAAIDITASRVDAEMDGMATALTESIARDGQTTITANLKMSTYKHTNVGASNSRTDYADTASVQDSSFTYVADTGAADAYVMTLAPAITAYAAGQLFAFKASNANTGASTVNVNSVGAKTIKKYHDQDLGAGDIENGSICLIQYDGTNFQLLNPVANAPLLNVVEDTTPQLGGALDTNSFAVNFSEGSAVASATAPDIWVTDGNTLHITGTTTITDFADAPNVGAWRWIIFDDALTFTHGSGITLPGSANITTAAGDMAYVYADAVDAFDVVYFPISGKAVIATTDTQQIRLELRQQ